MLKHEGLHPPPTWLSCSPIYYSHSILWNLLGSYYIFSLFLLFQITMPKCHKIYPNCIWHVPPEWFGLNFNTALLTKVFWNYTTHLFRVCLSSKTPINPNLPFAKKSNLQVKFGSKAMASLYDLFCHHSLTNTDPLLEKLLSHHLTRFHSHIFDYIAYEHSSGEKSLHSIDSSISAFYSDDSTQFS